MFEKTGSKLKAFSSRQFFMLGTFVSGIILSEAGLGQMLQIPVSIFQSLSSDDFTQREAGQVKLREWTRKNPEAAIGELLKQSEESADPEISARCLAALKDLVIEKHYHADGYLGIQMQEEELALPGQKDPVRCIRVMMVVAGSPANSAKVLAGDLIVGLDQQTWRTPGMAPEFAKTISGKKPGNEIGLSIFADNKVIVKKVVIGEKPAAFNPAAGNLDAANRAAKDQFFRDWLDKFKQAKR